MGMFASVIHIQNRQQLKQEEFIKSFCKYAEKKGLRPTTEESSQFSYFLAFSENCGWVTISSPNFEPGNDSAITETQKISQELKSICMEISVFDSDWAMIQLYDSLNEQRDTVVIGRAEEFLGEAGANKKGNRECWASLLTEGKRWEELVEVWNGDYIFVEEALEKTAPFLGMDSKNIRADYRVFECNSKDFNVAVLHFKSSEEAFIKEGPTKLCFGITSIPISGEENYYNFCNIGGISKGLGIILLGDCFKNHEVEISDIKIQRNKEPKKAKQYAKAHGGWIPMTPELEGGNEKEYFYADFKEYHTSDDRYGLIARFDEYVFFEGVNTEHPSMKGRNGQDLIWYYESSIWFTATVLSGEQHKFSMHVIPLSNWENQIGKTIKLYKTREIMNLENAKRREKREKSFKYLQEQVDSISKFPENHKKTKCYIHWLEEVVSKASDEWKDTPEYAQLLEELKNRKECN